MSEEPHTPALSQARPISRGVVKATVTITVIIAVAAFAMSYVQLTWLAREVGGYGIAVAWLFPLIIDGVMVASTIALFALANHPLRHRLFPTVLLGAFCAASIALNGAHAFYGADGAEVDKVAVVISALPPLVLALSVELAVRVIQRGTRVEEAEPVVQGAVPMTLETSTPTKVQPAVEPVASASVVEAPNEPGSIVQAVADPEPAAAAVPTQPEPVAAAPDAPAVMSMPRPAARVAAPPASARTTKASAPVKARRVDTEEIVRLKVENPGLSAAAIAARVGCSKATATRAIAAAKQEGLLAA